VAKNWTNHVPLASKKQRQIFGHNYGNTKEPNPSFRCKIKTPFAFNNKLVRKQ